MKSPTENRKPYSGLSRSLVIAIDVGTTFSGVSYAILEPGEIPKIHGVTRFPGQEHVAGNSKIPSVIYYDKEGKMMAAGAEADTTAVVSEAEDEGWIKTELFKLRLRPRTMQLNMNGMRLGPLPRNKTAVHVFGDFLAYMYRCTRNFITDTHGNGAALWNAVESDIQFVLSHPNGWEGAQQTKMRRAAVYGGLIPDTNQGKARIRFVTEGEASLHACVLNGLAADVLSDPSKHGFLIADAGGGTLDISAYAIRHTSPLIMEEIAPPDCIFAGSVFVSRRAREFLEEKLKGSKYGTPAALDHITQRFDETTKRLFRERNDLQFIPFGSPLDKDPAVGIRNGQLKLTGNEVANLFEPSVDAAITAIKAQIDASHGMIRSVFLVGGYAASPWLFSQLQERLAPFRVTVSRPDAQTSKAVADGAIGFYCDHHVSARMSKFMYGVEFLREMDPKDPDHVARKERLCELPSGPKLLPDAFDCVLSRSVKVKESTVFTRKYCTELTSLSLLSVFEVEIWCCRGNSVPKWIDRQSDDFSTLCVVRADLSPLSGSAAPKVGKNGKTYWTIVFSIEIHFGLTEFKARIKWVDEGKTKYGPASIIYNERGHRPEEEEPDNFPEDDIGVPRNDRLRSQPPSRPLTPTEFHQPSGSLEPRRASFAAEHTPKEVEEPVEIPVVQRVPTPPIPREIPADAAPPGPEMAPETGKKKGKGKEKTPKNTPKLETSFVSPLADPQKTPKLGDSLSAAWGSVKPSADLLSPVTPAEPRSPQIADSSLTDKEKGFLFDSISTKPSPAIGANRSPLGATEPIVAADLIDTPADPTPVTETIDTLANQSEPVVELDVAKEPVAQVATPAVETAADVGFQEAAPSGKKKKKKGASAVATPAVERTVSLDSNPVVPDPTPAKEPKAVVTELGPETRNIDAAEEVTNTVLGDPWASVDKPDSTKAPPALLPELSATTDGGGGLFGADSAASALFASSAWGSSTDKAKDTPDVQDNPQPPKTPKTLGWGAGGLGFGTKSGATTPKTPAASTTSPWGAATTPAAKTPSLGWGATTPKAPGWGAAKPGASPWAAASKSPWGKSSEPENAPEADKPTEADKPLENAVIESEKPVEPSKPVEPDPAATTPAPNAETEDKDALPKPEVIELEGLEENKGVDTAPAETSAPVVSVEEAPLNPEGGKNPEGDNIPATEEPLKDESAPPAGGANAEGGDDGDDDKGDGGGKGKKATKKKKKKK